ncbi:hypothetical protein POPTR_013G052950v4 [Populus trichocarpa]|uniref:Uncharacterized protein n=1 Tax=Populus trichocarpa TaxID=3694 RepID=A0ACC0S312_POPTR|nr:hypothetical protein BDE02_13G048700 [Populus trichocarpa]KAI9383246.1 hypothetical protein POPTR_013G052950v4 [Populus trichocarpa]
MIPNVGDIYRGLPEANTSFVRIGASKLLPSHE